MVDVDDEVARRQPVEDVARHDPAQRLWPPDADAAEQLAVRDEDEPVGPAGETAVEAPLDERDGAGQRRLSDPVDDRHGPALLGEDLGEARRLVGGEHDAPAVGGPGFDRDVELGGALERQGRLPPAEEVAAAQPAAGDRRVLRRLRFPGQLEGPRAQHPRLPVARRQVRGGPVLRQVPGALEVLAALVRLAPQELGGVGDVAGLVEHEEGARIEVIERGRRAQDAGPHLGGVADVERGAGTSGRRRVGGRLETLQVGSQALGQSGRPSAQPRPEAGHAVGRQEHLARRQEFDGVDRPDRALVGRVEGPQRVDLVPEELEPDRQRARRREHVDDAAPAGELTAAGHLDRRDVAEGEQFGEEGVEVQARAAAQDPWLDG